MKSKRTKEVQVSKKELLEELLAMLKTCFEGEAMLYEGAIYITLPGGESFTLNVDEAA